MTIATTVLCAFALTTSDVPPHVALVSLARPPAASVRVGVVKHYRPGLMARVAAKRGIRLCDGCSGWISTPDCRAIGRLFWVKVGAHKPVLTVAADCSRPGKDAARHLRTGLIGELDFSLAKRLGVVKTGKAKAQIWPAP